MCPVRFLFRVGLCAWIPLALTIDALAQTSPLPSPVTIGDVARLASERRDEITADYAPGEVVSVPQHDGSVIRLRKLAADYDPTNRIAAMNHLQERGAAGEVVTGLLYVDPQSVDMHEHIHTVGQPLNQLGVSELCPGNVALERINASLR